ncbi:protein FATTY ACID EXPORT 1, chloroplastic-like isoform X1 [Ananas comosus]|uniref:Protein FATTY ACID EXPORT 1, chloroplastic-like isoform X1 n=1 Tax=Ananas comosus TaxID=4615 RepID=A0A6P5F1C8_ANACO|nr:protein FATTY ACID EXPORT 1, chloroplastic-like isoform X1 [Ananas comosus]
MATTQLYGSVVAPRRSIVPSNGDRFSPLSSRVSSHISAGFGGTFSCGLVIKNPIFVASKVSHRFVTPSISMSVKGNSMRAPGFVANTAIRYTDDQTQEPMESNLTVEPVDENTKMDKEVALPPKKCAKIHDFCLGIPFGGFVFSVGVIGFLFWRSPASLVLGVAPGVVIMALGVLSLKVWRRGASSLPFILVQAAVALALTWKYFLEYNLTKKLLPWSIYGLLSAAMVCFYCYVLLAGGNPPPKQSAAAPLL